METATGLTAGDLLEKAYELICQKQHATELEISETLSEIANDSDWHRTRVGYMSYKLVHIITLKGQRSAISLGTKCGDYPGDHYHRNIIAIRIPEEMDRSKMAEFLQGIISDGSYFRHSIIAAMADGNLSVIENPFGKKILPILREKIAEFIAQEVKYQDGVVGLDLRPITSQHMLYKPEFAEVLSREIIKALS